MSGFANSIIARMGLDLDGVKRDFSSAEKLAVRSAHKMESEMKKASSGHGGGMAGNRAIGDSLDAITGTRGWVMRMTMLQHSLPIAAVAGLAIGLEKAHEAFEELVKASDHAREVLSKPMSVAVAGGDVTSYIEGLKKAQEELHEKNSGGSGVMATIGAMLHQAGAKLGNAVRGDSANDDSNEIVKSHALEKRLEEQRLAAAVQFKELTNQQIEERREAVAIGGKELEIVTARQRMEKEIANIQATAPTETRSTLINERRAAFDIEKEEIDRKQEASDRELDLQRALQKIKMVGRDVAVEEAKARLEAATKEKEAARGPQAYRAAQIKEQDASNAVVDAQNATDEHRAQLSIATAMANFRGPEDEKHLEKLDLEREQLEHQLRLLGQQDDKRKEINAKIAENDSQYRAAQREQEARVHSRADTFIDATTGEGESERARNIERKLAEAKRYQKQLNSHSESSEDARAAAGAKVAELTKQQAEMARSREKSVRDARNEVAVMTEQLSQHAAVADAMRTQFEFADKIAEAHRNGNKGLEEALKLQQRLALAGQVQNLQSQVDDRSKATLNDLAAHAMNQQGAAARRAKRLEDRANIEAGRGHTDHAKKLHAQADAIKKTIPGLKDSEKAAGLQQEQLDALIKIVTNTATIGKVQ
jgi:hypothetical protein